MPWQSLNKHWVNGTLYPLVKGITPNTPIEIKNKKETRRCITIRIIELTKKIKEYYEIIKSDVIKTLSGTKAECTLPIDTDALERIVRCVFPDIVKYYEEKRNAETSAPLTDNADLSDNKDAENL